MKEKIPAKILLTMLFLFVSVAVLRAETRNIYVKKDATGGNGSIEHPYTTIADAFISAKDSTQDTTLAIVIQIMEDDSGDGVYVLEPAENDTLGNPVGSLVWSGIDDTNIRNKALTIQAYSNDDIEISGAYEDQAAHYWDAEDSWHDIAGTANKYWHAWPYNWDVFSEDDIPSNDGTHDWVHDHHLLEYREMFFQNGQRFEQVQYENDLDTLKFWIDSENSRIYIMSEDTPGPGDEFIVPNNEILLEVKGCASVTLENLTFRYANSLFGNAYMNEGGGVSRRIGNAAVVIGNCNKVVIDNCRFLDCNWAALKIGNCPSPSRDLQGNPYYLTNHEYDFPSVQITDCTFENNGIYGFEIGRVIGLEMTGDTTRNNNLRGYSAGTMTWACGANKLQHVHNAFFHDDVFENNKGKGFWFDTDCKNIHMVDCDFNNNYYDGIFLENNEGPIALYDCDADTNTLEATNSAGGIRPDSARGGSVDVSVTNQLLVYGGSPPAGTIGNSDYQIFLSRVYRPNESENEHDFRTGADMVVRPIYNQFVKNKIDFIEANDDSLVGRVTTGNVVPLDDYATWRLNWVLFEDNTFVNDSSNAFVGRIQHPIPFDYEE